MELLKKREFQDYLPVFLGGILGFLAALFVLHFIYYLTVGKVETMEKEISLISFFRKTAERQATALGILLSFSFLGIASGIAGMFHQRIKRAEERNRLLERVDQAKTEFVSLASHQLRAPLTAIKWSFKMMLDGDFGGLNPQQEKIVSRDIEANERLVYLVRDLLDISRIEQQRFEMRMKYVSISDMKQIIKTVVDELMGLVKKKNHSLSLNTGPLSGNQMILIDPEKVIQIIQNLLENAVDYTPEGGRIQMKIEEKNNNLLVNISDTGIGIPKTEQNKIFDKFFRAGNVRKMRGGGAGLGLYLCKTLIEMQGGKIWFTSEEGKGTIFSFSLPFRGRTPVEESLRKL